MRRNPAYRHAGFGHLAEHFYQELLRRNPIFATWLGEHQYDGLLPEVGAEAVEKEITFYRGMRDAFNALPERELSLDERLDRQIVLQMVQMQLFHQEDLRRWRLGSDLAMMVGDALFLLFVRDFAPLAHRLESIISRLKSVPVFLMSGRTLFQQVPALWGEIYIDSLERLPEFLKTIETSIAGRVPATLANEYLKASIEAQRSIGQHLTWFRNAILPTATGDWSMGTGPFQAMLALRHLGLSAGEILDIGENALAHSREKLETLAHRLTGGGHVSRARAEAYGRIKSKAPPSFEQALDAYRDAVARSRAFVELTQFATLPPEETLEVLETPSFMAHLIPFAAYLGPERTARPQKGIYLVTRGDKGDLGRHNYADVANTSVHEGYPGHHLQITAQNLHPSRIRILADSVELIEGWAHYCEEEVKRMGFESSDENLFVQANDESWRAARILIDVNIHQKTWTYDHALNFLRQHTDMDQESAVAEMRRYTQTPGYQLSYLVGKHLLIQLKESLKQQYAGDFSNRAFHDLVLYEGSIPIFLGREYYPQLLRESLSASSRGAPSGATR